MIGIPRRWTEAASAKTPDNPVSLAEATRVWVRIGWLSFGGPAGQIALMHRELVEQRRWISDARFLHALSYCMLLPGPEAQQLAIYIGWLMHRTTGCVIAGTLFVLPGVIVIGVLSWLYATYQQLPAVTAIFFGLKAAVLAVVVEAVLRVGRRALKNRVMIAIAAAASVCRRVRGLSCTVVRASRWGDAALRPSQRVRQAGHVLRGSRAGNLRRRLCGARLCRATRRRDVRLAQPGRDARRSGACRNHAWPADHGGAVRGFHCGVPPSRQSVALCGRCARLAADYLGHIPAVLPVDLPRRALHRVPAQQPHTECGPRRNYGGRGGRHTQPVSLVRRAHRIPHGADADHQPHARRCPGVAQRRFRRADAQRLRTGSNAAFQAGDGLYVIRQRSAWRWHLDIFPRWIDIGDA